LITQEAFLIVEGRLQHVDNVIHVRAEKIERLEANFAGTASHDFR
jgi:hypothetical protein